jgi:hypothetical protein
MGSGGEARPQAKRGQVSFRGASSDEKKALARVSRGACQAQYGRGVSAANRRRKQIQIFALAKKEREAALAAMRSMPLPVWIYLRGYKIKHENIIFHHPNVSTSPAPSRIDNPKKLK